MKQYANHKPQKVRTLIVDDEPEAITMLKMLTDDIETIEITGTTCDPDKVLSAYLKATPDLLLLDIHLGTRTGFEVLQELHEHKLFPLVIFTTAHDQYLLKAIRAGAFDYLLKPIDKTELIEALIKVERQLSDHHIEHRIEALEKALESKKKMKLNTRTETIYLEPDDILYIEADWSYSTVYLVNGKRETISMNIGSLEKTLPDGKFFRINRSIVIQLSSIQMIDRKAKKCHIKLDGQEKIFPISYNRIVELDEMEF